MPSVSEPSDCVTCSPSIRDLHRELHQLQEQVRRLQPDLGPHPGLLQHLPPGYPQVQHPPPGVSLRQMLREWMSMLGTSRRRRRRGTEW